MDPASIHTCCGLGGPITRLRDRLQTLAAGNLLAAATLGVSLSASAVCAEPRIFEGAFEPEAVSLPRAAVVRYQVPPAEPPADPSTEPAAEDPPTLEFLELSLEELSGLRVRAPLLEQEVTTVSRQASTVGRSPAAVFVVTNEMIRRSGATSIPEADRWQLYAQYTFLRTQLHRSPGSGASEAAEGQSPRNQVYVRSSWDIASDWEFDLIGRYVDHLPGFAPGVPSYITFDARLGWQPRERLELAIVGQNLLDSQHLEFGSNALIQNPLVEVPRGVYGQVVYQW